MNKLYRPLAAVVLATLALSANALSATKREIPLWMTGVYFKGTPIQTAGGAEGLAFDGTQIWVANRANNTVTRYDAASNVKATGANGTITFPAPGSPRKLAFDGTYMWVFTIGDNKAYKYSTSGALQNGFPITLPGECDGAAFDGQYMWASVYPSGEGQPDLVRIDISSRAQVNYTVGNTGSIAYDGANLWITRTGTTKLNIATGEITPDSTTGGADGTNGIVFDGEYIWALSPQSEATIYKIDAATNTLETTVQAPCNVHGIAFDGSRLWVNCPETSQTLVFDAATHQLVKGFQLPLNSNPYDVHFDGTHMWVSAQAGGPQGQGALFKFFAKMP